MSVSSAAPNLTASTFFSAGLGETDPELFGAIGDELGRQQDQIELIASENIVSRAVLEAQGSVLTNKYAEGYPGRRYYGGCEFVDVAESLAIDRALDGADLVEGGALFIERIRSRPLPPAQIAATPRIGVDYAGAWARRPLRFVVRDDPCVSRPPAGASSGPRR